MAGIDQPADVEPFPDNEDKKPRSRWRRLLWRIARVAVLAYVGAGVILVIFQSKYVYLPKRDLETTPDEWAMAYEDVSLTAADGVKLHGWYVRSKAKTSRAGVVLFCHGNAGNISHRIYTIQQLAWMGVDVFIFDYRGYGKSAGKPSEKGTYLDAEAAWDYLVEQRGLAPEEIVIFGRSLGGSIAAHLAKDRKPAAVVIESTFANITDLAAKMMPLFPVRLMCRFDYDTEEYVRQITSPVLVIHSRDDDMIPFEHGRRVFEAANDPKEFLEITGTHNEGPADSRDYEKPLRRFITGNLPKPPGPPGTGGHPDRAAQAAPTREYKVVHVFVALCDNDNQSIAPVPAALGDGQDPKGNLYWGAMYGVKTFFARSGHWTAVSVARPVGEAILDRCVFRSRPDGGVYVVADAYDGARMKTALADFFSAAAGAKSVPVSASVAGRTLRLRAGADADMVCFVGHNGLMDVRLEQLPRRSGRRGPGRAVVLACKSDAYFTGPLKQAGCKPLITTSGLMAPEAYTLEAIIRSWSAGESPAKARQAAAGAYAKYQRCSLAAARRLFVPGEP